MNGIAVLWYMACLMSFVALTKLTWQGSNWFCVDCGSMVHEVLVTEIPCTQSIMCADHNVEIGKCEKMLSTEINMVCVKCILVEDTSGPGSCPVLSARIDQSGKQGSLAFNQDAWKAPNVTSMMAATAPHYIDEHFILQDITITMPHVTGKSLGPLNQ
ncbi:uncharacterized protein VP01_5396g1 [Puccinia sorghi]|uniref:Uncharacterized protein n=1 Tax=Puccinia sorghi TaxID=27349 RepID=A0A0L6UJV2_9BASI|nr:uncharacterized protein VP01_5396g1 [Puccinia sorghi]